MNLHDMMQCHLESVAPVPQLKTDLDSLSRLMYHDTPPVQLVHTKKISVTTYGFRDTSSSGFGSTLLLPGGVTSFQHGVWGHDADSLTSNFRELAKLVAAVEEGIVDETLHNSELFLFNDNWTRMIAQGTDGLSHGDYTTGVMAGAAFKPLLKLICHAVPLGSMHGIDLFFMRDEEIFIIFNKFYYFYDAERGHDSGAPNDCIAGLTERTASASIPDA